MFLVIILHLLPKEIASTFIIDECQLKMSIICLGVLRTSGSLIVHIHSFTITISIMNYIILSDQYTCLTTKVLKKGILSFLHINLRKSTGSQYKNAMSIQVTKQRPISTKNVLHVFHCFCFWCFWYVLVVFLYFGAFLGEYADPFKVGFLVWIFLFYII